MILKNIKLVNFRNYNKVELNLNENINILYGNNGQGKTNILESIYVLCITKSHRSFIDHNLIKDTESNSKLSGTIVENGINYNLEVKINKTNKKVMLDNKEVKKLSSYIEKMSIIIFYPDDLDLIKGGPSVRRRYMNLELAQLNPNYLNNLTEYNKLLKIRNDLLKQPTYDENYFEIVTNYLVDKGTQIYIDRNKFINSINEKISTVYESLSEISKFNIFYKNNIKDISENNKEVSRIYKTKLEKVYSVERKLGMTIIGPHRDDIEFFIDKFDLKRYGSQGQQRMAVLSLKLSEIELFKKYKNSVPILLLDDVFSELDNNKKNNLLKFISKDIQTIITTTDLKNIDDKLLKNALILKVNEGNIEEVKE